MSKVRAFWILSAFIMSLVSCTKLSSRLSTESHLFPTAELYVSPVSTPESLGIPGTFSGEGAKTLSIWIEPGVWIFRIIHKGDLEFGVSLYDREGKLVKNMRWQAGNSPELGAINVKQGGAGIYRLEISADGSWIIDVRGCSCPAESE